MSCEGVLMGACGCPALCLQDSVVRIDPGGRYPSMWPGAYTFDVQLPGGCENEFCGDSCTAIAQAPAGSYLARAVAGTAVDCGAPECECLDAPDPLDFCRITGVIAGDEHILQATFDYPQTTDVVLPWP
jgi:hypothetical protein